MSVLFVGNGCDGVVEVEVMVIISEGGGDGGQVVVTFEWWQRWK